MNLPTPDAEQRHLDERAELLPEEQAAGSADRIGSYVLSYRTNEQHSTPPTVRQAYADKVRELVGPTP